MSKITKQQLGAKIWEAAKTLRKNLEAYEYKDYILGLLLYKFLCQKQIEYLIEDGVSKDDLYLFDNKLDFTNFNFEKTKIEDKDEIDKIRDLTKDSIGYFIEYHNLFNYWVENKNDFNIDVFQRAFNDFNDAVNKTEKNKF